MGGVPEAWARVLGLSGRRVSVGRARRAVLAQRLERVRGRAAEWGEAMHVRRWLG